MPKFTGNRQDYVIQRGLTDDFPNSYSERHATLESAVKRVKELKAIAPTAEFRIVGDDSWDRKKARWNRMWNEKGERIP